MRIQLNLRYIKVNTNSRQLSIYRHQWEGGYLVHKAGRYSSMHGTDCIQVILLYSLLTDNFARGCSSHLYLGNELQMDIKLILVVYSYWQTTHMNSNLHFWWFCYQMIYSQAEIVLSSDNSLAQPFLYLVKIVNAAAYDAR